MWGILSKDSSESLDLSSGPGFAEMERADSGETFDGSPKCLLWCLSSGGIRWTGRKTLVHFLSLSWDLLLFGMVTAKAVLYYGGKDTDFCFVEAV